MDVRDAFEAGGEATADLFDALEPAAPRVGPARRLEDAVLGEVAQDRVEVVRVEAFQDFS